MADTKRLMSLGVAGPLAKELSAQLTSASAWANITGKPAVIAAGADAATARTAIGFDAAAKAAIAAKTEVAALAAMTVTATTGSLPTPGGSTTIANTATPTVTELLDFCVELKAKVDAIVTALKA